MKKLYLIILCVTFYFNCDNPFSNSDNEQRISTLSQINSASKIHFVDSNFGWAIGNNGNLLKTIDGGKNWDKIKFENEEDLIAIDFINQDVGWISTEKGVYKTIDQGQNWKLQLRDSTLSKFNKIEFIDASLGWVTGPTNGSLYNTTNGGANWTLITINTVGRIVDVQFLNQNTGWIISAGGEIFKTTNNGLSWQRTNNVRFAWNLNLIDNSTCFVGNNIWASSLGNDSANIYRTDDGGSTWRKQTVPKVDAVSKVIFKDKSIGWSICGNSLCFTENGGNEWSKLNLGSDYPIDITIAAHQLVILTKSNKVLKIN